jgi:hypothetical protein
VNIVNETEYYFLLNATTRNRAIVISTSSSTKRDQLYYGDYDLHNILCQRNTVEWYLNIDENNNAVKIAKNISSEFRKTKTIFEYNS